MTRSSLLLLLFLAGTACVSSNISGDIDLRSDKDKIERTILSKYPLGTDLETIKQYLTKKGVREEMSKYPSSDNTLIKAYAGSVTSLYELWFPVTVDVTMFFRFDHNKRLIDIWVTKDTDAL